MVKGSCCCGQCSYTAAGKLFDIMHCHCATCRKLHGTAFATYAGVFAQGFSWLCDTSKLREFKTSKNVTRYFCRSCGSLLTSADTSEPDTMYLTAGLIDSDIDIVPEYHQFTLSKAPWYEISDALPQYEGECDE